MPSTLLKCATANWAKCSCSSPSCAAEPVIGAMIAMFAEHFLLLALAADAVGAAPLEAATTPNRPATATAIARVLLIELPPPQECGYGLLLSRPQRRRRIVR